MKICKSDCCTVSHTTFVIAASDSLHKKRADYVCDGVDDQVEIQAAIDALPDAGGSIHFTAGMFYINDTVSVIDKTVVLYGANGGVTWSGYPLGYSGTMFAATSTLDKTILEISGSAYMGGLYEIGFTGYLLPQEVEVAEREAVFVHNNGDFIISHCGFFSLPYTGPVEVSCHGSWISNCDFEYNHMSSWAALNVDRPRNWITNCYFSDNQHSLMLLDNQISVDSCVFTNAKKNHIYLISPTDVTISNCKFNSWNTIAGDHSAIELQGGIQRHHIIHDNIFDGAGCGTPAIWDGGGSVDYISIHDNLIRNMGGTPAINMATANTNGVIQNNIGYVTKNSGTSTGTGAQQTIAHGLAATPTKVILWNIEDGANPYQSASANATNIYITSIANQDYGWEAEVV